MNRILMSWHEQNLHTLAQIEAGDSLPSRRSPKQTDPKGTQVRAAYERLLAEEGE